MMITKIFDREKRQRKKERQASHRWDGDRYKNQNSPFNSKGQREGGNVFV